MARKGREISSTGMYHILLRGNGELFFSQKDYHEFLALLKKYFSNDSAVYAYSLDKNKIHLVILTQGMPSDKLKPLCTGYARYVNRVYNKTGRLFYDRFISEPIENNEALFKAVRYIIKIPSHLSSKEEYTDKAEVCDVTGLGNRINLRELFVSDAVIPCTDNFSDMSDSELKRLILRLSSLKNTVGNLAALKEYIITASAESNLSRSRLFRIFDMGGAYSGKAAKQISSENKKAKKNKNTEKIENPESEDSGSKKKELSVWLL